MFLKRNFGAYLLSTSFYGFGASLISGAVVMTLFVSNLSSSRLLVGLIMTLTFAGALLPQVFTTPLVARLQRIKRPLLAAIFFAYLLPLLLWGPAILAITPRAPQVMLVVFFILLAWYAFGTGFTQVGSQELYARAIPVDKRGRLSGISAAVGLILGLGGAALNEAVLKGNGFPSGYGMLFLIAALAYLAGWGWLWLLKEPSLPATPEAGSEGALTPAAYRAFFRRIPELLKRDPNYTRFLISMSVLYLGGMSGNFLAISAKDRWNLPESLIVNFPFGLYAGEALGALACGWIADRMGYKILQIIANVANVILLVIAILAGEFWLFYIIFALKGISTAADSLGGMITYEFSSPDLRPAYIGIYNTTAGIVFLISPLVAGALAQAFGYAGLFWITAVITASGVVMLHAWVKEPRAIQPVPSGA